LGYSSTAQLSATLEGDALISTKAVINLIQNYNVNPTFLFTGKGEMFLIEETEIEKLRKENREWIQRHNEAVKTVMELNELVKIAEKRYNDLIDLTSAAIKYHKGEKAGDIEKEIKESSLKNKE
jgi:hypothetical protein